MKEDIFMGCRNALQYIKTHAEKFAARFSVALTYISGAIFSFLFGDKITNMRSRIRNESLIST